MVECDRRELGAVVTLNDGGDPMLVAQVTQRRHHIGRAVPDRRYQASTFACVRIDDAQHAKRRAIGKLIEDKVHCPALIRRARLYTHEAHFPAAAPLRPLPLLGQSFVAIETMDSLVIHRPAFAAQQRVQPSTAVRAPRLRQLTKALPERLLRRRHPRVVHARARDAARATCGALGDRVRLLHPAHPRPPLRWAHH